MFNINKRLLRLLAVVPILVTISANTALAQTSKSLEKVVVKVSSDQVIEFTKLDRRAEVLQAYLNQFNSPLASSAQHFVEAADLYDLDWMLVAAIAGVESTFGKHIPGGYNAWGWGVYGTNVIYFDSWKDGIYTVTEGLRKNYFDRGLTEPYAINRAYAASPHWGGNVTYFLRDMTAFRTKYEAENRIVVRYNLSENMAGASGKLND